MKNQGLTVENMMKWKGQIESGQSVGIVSMGGKNFTVKTVTEYVSAFVSQLQNGEMLILGNVAMPGIRSIADNKLPVGKHLLVTQVRVLADTSQALETAAAIITLPWASNAPVAFKNAEFSISQGTELFRTIGTDVTNFKASTGNDADFRDIVPFHLRPQSPTSFKVTLAQGAAPAAGTALRLEIRCLEFVETNIL